MLRTSPAHVRLIRGRAGDSTRSATHGRANRGARRASDRKRHETPDRRADTGAAPARLPPRARRDPGANAIAIIIS